MSARAGFEADQVVSHFRVRSMIGRGGMGMVYRALDEDLRREVVLKILLPDNAGDEKARQRLLREARAASALNHPNVVTIHEVGHSDGVDFIAMEFVDGRTLSECIGEGPLAIDFVLDKAIQLLDGLSFAHQHGVLHRDLKPGNLLVTSTGRLKILDFGLAKHRANGPEEAAEGDTLGQSVEQALTEPGMVVGTAHYMPPEQLEGRITDERSDLYSVGCILYEMLSGDHVFHGDSPIHLAMCVLRDPPVPISERRGDVPNDLARLIDRLLAKQPVDRPSSASQVRDEIERMRGNSGSQGTAVTGLDATTVLPASSNPVRRSSRWWSVAAVPVVVALIGVGWMVYGRGAPPQLENDRLLTNFPGRFDGPAFAPDGTRVAFSGAQEVDGIPQLWIMDLVERRPRRLTEGNEASTQPQFTSDGTALIFSRANQGIWRIGLAESGDVQQLVASGNSPAISSQGGLAWEDDGVIWMADADGGHQRRLEGPVPTRYGGPMAPAFSPDGHWITWFQAERDTPHGRIWIASTSNDVAPRPLTDEPRIGGWPAWTPDGRYIVYAAAKGDATTLWSVRVSDGTLTQLTTGAGDDGNVTVSPDGTKVAYTRHRKAFAILRRDATTGNVSTLLAQESDLVYARLSPDEKRVAYFAPVDQSAQIFTIAVDGSDRIQLTHDANSINMSPRWSSSGNEILYYRNKPRPALVSIPANGGEVTPVAEGWSWGAQTHAELDGSGTRLVYTLVTQGVPQGTRIRNLSSGREQTIPRILNSPVWSPDDASVLGHTDDSRILRCAVEGGVCRDLGAGIMPTNGRNGSIYVIRADGESQSVTVWALDNNGNESIVGSLRDAQWGGFSYGVMTNGDIVWSASLPGTEEILTADLK